MVEKKSAPETIETKSNRRFQRFLRLIEEKSPISQVDKAALEKIHDLLIKAKFFVSVVYDYTAIYLTEGDTRGRGLILIFNDKKIDIAISDKEINSQIGKSMRRALEKEFRLSKMYENRYRLVPKTSPEATSAEDDEGEIEAVTVTIREREEEILKNKKP